MDEDTKQQIFDRAYELVDPEKREHDRLEHEAWLDQRKLEIENAQADALVERLARRRERQQKSELIYKNYGGPQPEQTAVQQSWNEWADTVVKSLDVLIDYHNELMNSRSGFTDRQVEEIGGAISLMRKQWKKHIEAAVAEQASRVDVLERRLAALEAEDKPSGYQG